MGMEMPNFEEPANEGVEVVEEELEEITMEMPGQEPPTDEEVAPSIAGIEVNEDVEQITMEGGID